MEEIQYNYQFCFRGIKQAFFFFTTMYPDKFSDEKFAQGIFEAAVDFCERKIGKGFIERPNMWLNGNFQTLFKMTPRSL